ncbi:protein MNN4-like [Scomber scombrus]|uniref:Protein MNN4-like n=1 Tax=Scomber scombrus TaxID=13677 RepID=A0AAV1NRK4_SCOSC
MKQSNQQWKSRFEALEMCLSEEQAHSEQSWRRKLEEMENEKSQLCVPCGLKRRRTGRKLALSTKVQLEKANQLQEEKEKKDEKEEHDDSKGGVGKDGNTGG